jgi:hypothetical protein
LTPVNTGVDKTRLADKSCTMAYSFAR